MRGKEKIKIMAKFDPYNLNHVERAKLLDEFYAVIAGLNGKQEIKNFLKDLLTPSEAVMLARRIKIAKLLMEGAGCEDIRNKLGVGFENINRVRRWLYEGFDGYLKALEKKQ